MAHSEESADAGDTGSVLGRGGSHMLWSSKAPALHLLSLCSRAWGAAATEAREPALHNKRSHCNRKPMHCNKRVPPAR